MYRSRQGAHLRVTTVHNSRVWNWWPIGHHSKEGTFNGKVHLTIGHVLRNDLGDAQPLPDGLKDIDGTKGPGID